MKPTDAQRIIRHRAGQSHNVVFLPHAQQRMRSRQIDALSVLRCLRRGIIAEGPYRDIKSGQWRCNVEATVSGEWLRVVVEIPDTPPHLEVITVIGLEN